MIKNKSLQEILQPVVSFDAENNKATIDLSLLDPEGAISTGEGIVYALLKLAYNNQESGTEKGMDIAKPMPFIGQRSGMPVQGTSLHIRFYSSEPIPELSPEQI